MLPRIWVLLLTVLLLAAPASAAFEISDAKAECAPDDLVATAAVVVVTAPRSRIICVRLESEVPAEPVLARIFRPPRASAV